MKPKNAEPRKNWITEQLDRIEKNKGTYLRSQFYIIEKTPSEHYYSGDGHGGRESNWTKAIARRVSSDFETFYLAQVFMDKHVPDKGNFLSIVEERLYRKTTETWY
jgi:hypothetical protein